MYWGISIIQMALTLNICFVEQQSKFPQKMRAAISSRNVLSPNFRNFAQSVYAVCDLSLHRDVSFFGKADNILFSSKQLRVCPAEHAKLHLNAWSKLLTPTRHVSPRCTLLPILSRCEHESRLHSGGRLNGILPRRKRMPV